MMMRSPRSPRFGERAFSLIEVMVASVLFLVTLAGVISAFHTATRLFAHYEAETSALTIGESVMEDLLLRGRGDPLLVDGSTTTFTVDEDGTPSPGGKFTVTWTITGATPLDGLRTIDLRITWADGANRQIRLTTVRE